MWEPPVPWFRREDLVKYLMIFHFYPWNNNGIVYDRPEIYLKTEVEKMRVFL